MEKLSCCIQPISRLDSQNKKIKKLVNRFITNQVYLSHPAGREEYGQAEVGKLYGGSHNNVQGRPWVFGQTKDSVLPAVCHLLDNVSNLKDSERGDPVKVNKQLLKIYSQI